MGIISWIYYLIIGLILFIIISYLQKKFKLTKLEQFIITNILLVTISGISNRLIINYNSDIFLSLAFLMIIDIIYQGYFLGRDFFDKEEANLKYYILLIIVGFLINQEFINRVNEVFLTGEDFRLIIWFLIIIYIYQFIKNKDIFSYKVKEKHFLSEEGILIQYTKLKYRYPTTYENDKLKKVLYSIMLYENHRRGKILRYFDNLKYRITGNPRKLGIMQVDSKKFITDAESIDIVYKKLDKLYNNKNSKKTIPDLIKSYNKESAEDIMYIYNIIEKI